MFSQSLNELLSFIPIFVLQSVLRQPCISCLFPWPGYKLSATTSCCVLAVVMVLWRYVTDVCVIAEGAAGASQSQTRSMLTWNWLQRQPQELPQQQPASGIERVQALADILRSPLCCRVHRLHICASLCCHSNKTHAPIVNLPSGAQLGGTPYHSPKLHLGPCSSAGMRRGTDTQAAVTTVHFVSSMTHAKCN